MIGYPTVKLIDMSSTLFLYGFSKSAGTSVPEIQTEDGAVRPNNLRSLPVVQPTEVDMLNS